MNGITNNDMQLYSLHDQANQMGEPSNRLYKRGNMDRIFAAVIFGTVGSRPIPAGWLASCSSVLGRYSGVAGVSLSDWPLRV